MGWWVEGGQYARYLPWQYIPHQHIRADKSMQPQFGVLHPLRSKKQEMAEWFSPAFWMLCFLTDFSVKGYPKAPWNWSVKCEHSAPNLWCKSCQTRLHLFAPPRHPRLSTFLQGNEALRNDQLLKQACKLAGCTAYAPEPGMPSPPVRQLPIRTHSGKLGIHPRRSN